MTESSKQPENDIVQDRPWANRKVVVGLGGGISCYKVATLVSSLVKLGADVRVLMTPAATEFVTPLTFQSLSGYPVVTSNWQAYDHHESPHVGLASWTDLVILAPATMDLLGKLAAGLTDDPVTLLTSALSADIPVLLAPAMNSHMWNNPINQRNIETLKQLAGYQVVGPKTGWQACRTEGPGRMAEPEQIADTALALVQSSSGK